MSKVDAMQAMREARYAQRTAAVKKTPAAPVEPVRAPSTKGKANERNDAEAKDLQGQLAPGPTLPDLVGTPSTVEAPLTLDVPSVEALCGHRSMNGRSCRRPAGHAEKNHRYS